MRRTKFSAILRYKQITYFQPEHQTEWEFKKKKKERNSQIVDFVVSAGHKVKIKENELRDKYLLSERKKIWNMKVTVIGIVICARGTVLKSFIRGLEELETGGRIETTKLEHY